jgi:hypothetical protein
VFKARLTDQNTRVVPFLLKLVLTLRPALKNSALRARRVQTGQVGPIVACLA